MAGPEVNIRSFDAPLSGPGRSAPTLLEDLILFDPLQTVQPGYHLLEDGARSFAQAQSVGQLLPPGSCFHDFCLKKRQSSPPAIDERQTPESVWHVSAICQKCRVHLRLEVDYRVVWRDRPCPTYENPLHHLVRSTWRQDAAYRDLSREGRHNLDELHVYECSSVDCSAIVTVHLTPPVFAPEALHMLLDKQLLAKRTDAAFEQKKGHTEGMKRPLPIDVLVDLRAYLQNAWKREERAQISIDNKRFAVRFGPEGKACSDVLEMLGFELKPGESWSVPQPNIHESLPLRQPHNIFLDNVEIELDALIANRPQEERQAAQDTTKLESALIELTRVLSCQNYDRDPSSRTTKKSLLQRSRAFTILGIPEDASDDLIVWAYQRQMALENDAMQTAKLMTALEDVQKQRQSEKLSEQVAIEWSQGRYGEQAISDAFRSFGISPDADLSDEVILGNFEARLSDAPAQEQQMRESLARIGDYRKSQKLVDYARNQISTYEDALSYLGAGLLTDDSFLYSLYTSKIDENAAYQDMAQKAMKLIADHRDSEQLKAFVAAGFQGDIAESKMDLGDAYKMFNVEDRTMDDETLFMVYEMALGDDAAGQPKYRKAIETIAEEKNSVFLKDKLQMPGGGQQQPQTTKSLTEPIGLDNIGNTCYLNSLLQSLFTIGALREIVLDFEQYKQQLGQEHMKNKRVGQRLISEREVKSAQNFVAQLAELFRQMIVSPDRAIRPAQELARLTLETEGIKQARRNSTLQSQRRPTLGTIDSRPIIGPLPQPTIDQDTVQPLQSPELREPPNLESDKHLGGQPIARRELEPIAPADDEQHENTSSETALVLQDEPGVEDTATGNVTQSQHGSVLSSENHKELSQQKPATLVSNEPVKEAASEEATEAQEISRSRTPSPDPLKQEQSIEAKEEDVPTVYKPPEGKPPPVPPRPLATATLESYARQQDVTEVLAHAIFQLSCATRPTGFDRSGEQQDEFHDIFYGEEQKHVLHGTASPQAPVQFLIETLPINNEPKDLYAALDNYFDLEEVGTSEVYVTITKLPPILCVGFGRAIQDASRNMLKINHHVDLPETIFMDRYIDAPENSALVNRRKQTWSYKKELRKLQARIDQLEPKGKSPVNEVLNTALAALQHLSDLGATENLDGLTTEADTITKMSDLSHAVSEERKDLHNRIRLLNQQINDSFTDAAFRKHEYKLHAAFFHRGTVGSGHYWIYIFDHVNEIWRKYNDDHVTHVTDLREIFGNPQDDRNNPNAGYNPANPYFMLYVRSDCISPEAGIVETVKRDPVVPPTPVIQSNENNTTNAQTFTGDSEEMSLRPLGTDTPHNEASADSSHHEFSGQQSQMSYLPPDGPPPGQKSVDQSWQDEDEDVRLAIERSLRAEGAKKVGEWDDSENMEVHPNQW
ncbi:ubiquitin-specific protease ubp2 [Knufia fluminis]|uniref:ubiquitinyl hydrolase 1 n=1 Tax=Knufia fluminis TaxID=191047 RepID=A0AAN8ERX7_9EURO|nr:ubiquitin-specific protease ubp2 [Knufia fluminis]